VPGLTPGIRAQRPFANFKSYLQRRRVDGRDKPGHDVGGRRSFARPLTLVRRSNICHENFALAVQAVWAAYAPYLRHPS
jgi:hypothetical protein